MSGTVQQNLPELSRLGITDKGVNLSVLRGALVESLEGEKYKIEKFCVHLRRNELRTIDNVMDAVVGRLCRGVIPNIDLFEAFDGNNLPFDVRTALALSYLDEYKYQRDLLVKHTAVIIKNLFKERAESSGRAFVRQVANETLSHREFLEKEAFIKSVMDALKPETH